MGPSEAGGMIGGSLMDMLFGSDPYGSAMNEMQGIPSYFKDALLPYMNEGKSLLGPLTSQFTNMMQNPGNVLSRIQSGYTQTPGYNFQVNQGIGAANRGMAPTGMSGTAANQVQLQQLGTNLANQNMNQYTQNALGLFNRGLSGLGGLEQQGFGAGEDYAGDMANFLSTMAQLKAAQAQQKNNQLGGLGSGIGWLLGAS